MKLRILGNSLRLRLSQSEVNNILNDGHVSDSMDLGTHKFIYALQLSEVDAIHATMDGLILTVDVPEMLGKKWASGQQTGMEETVPLEKNKGTLKILIEKDFACLKPREGEDEDDLFPNPSRDE